MSSFAHISSRVMPSGFFDTSFNISTVRSVVLFSLSVYTISVIQYTSVRQEMQEEITINTAINNTAIKNVFSTGSLPV